MKEEALRLADELETRIATQGFEFTKEAATMLRQQAKRIEELEKQWYMVNKDGYVKPLSDEEIKEIADSVCYLIDKDKKGRTKGAMYIEDFARAIEERHGIK